MKKPSRSSTWGSTTSADLNLDKPLPIEPLRPTDQSKAVNFSRPKPPRIAGKQPELARAPSNHTRSASLDVPRLLSSRTWGPENANAVQQRKAVRPHQRPRSKSIAVAELEVRPLAPRKAHRRAPTQDQLISAGAAERVIHRIMAQLAHPRDVQSCALVSKGFFKTFQRNESSLVGNLIYRTSRPAWEMRKRSLALKSAVVFKLCDYQRDLRTIAALKSLIMAHCISICRPRTVRGLLGQDIQASTEIDGALWRIWTYCIRFGQSFSTNSHPTAEIAWLKGRRLNDGLVMDEDFAAGNGNGLTSAELEDMNEIWQCLQMLMGQFHGRVEEARRTGVLHDWNVNMDMTQQQVIMEWTAYLLTLGLHVVLTLSSGSFEKAKMLRLTRFALPSASSSRSLFLTAAISEAYQARLLAEATAKAAQFKIPSQSRHRVSRSMDLATGPVQYRESLRIETHSVRRRPLSTSVPRTASIEIRPDCDPAAALSARGVFPASPTADPSFYHTLTLTQATSARLGATLFPVSYVTATPKIPFPRQAARQPLPVDVVDPIDKALRLLVQEMGFPEANAKRALAMTDTGSGIDVNRAIEMLSLDSKPRQQPEPVELPTPIDIVSPLPRKKRASLPHERCDGECTRHNHHSLVVSSLQKRTSMISQYRHSRSHSAGTTTEFALSSSSDENTSDVPISPITDIYGGHSDDEAATTTTMSREWRREATSGDKMSPLVTMSPNASLGRANTKSSAITTSRKAWRVLGVGPEGASQQFAAVDGNKKRLVVAGLGIGMVSGIGRSRSKSSVVGMEEYLARIERRKSMRASQENWSKQSKGQVFGMPIPTPPTTADSDNIGTSGSGNEKDRSTMAVSGGLGGLRPVVATREVREEKSWRAFKGVKREKTMRERIRMLPGGERLILE
jgi:hypothetical protein